MFNYTITFKSVDGAPPVIIHRTAASGLTSGTNFILYRDPNRTQLMAAWPIATIETIDSVPA